MRVGYLGPPPTFSEIAARQLYPGEPLRSFENETAVLSALRTGEINEGVLPLENQVGGYIPSTLDLIAEHDDLCIVGEHLLNVSFSLYRAEQDYGPVRRLSAHAVAFLQCRRLVSELSVTTEAMSSNGAAVRRVLESHIPGEAALGPPGLERHMALRLEREGVEDLPNVVTRFARCALTPADKAGSRAILMIRPDPEQLGPSLVEFAGLGRVTRVASRAAGASLGDYRYLIELDKPAADRQTLVRTVGRWRGRIVGGW